MSLRMLRELFNVLRPLNLRKPLESNLLKRLSRKDRRSSRRPSSKSSKMRTNKLLKIPKLLLMEVTQSLFKRD